MASFDTRLEAVTNQRIDEAIIDSMKILGAGQLASHADYRYHCGVIEGLRRAQALMLQALDDIQKG